MTTWDFACSDPVDISIDSWASGSIVVSGEPTTTVTVEVVPGSRSADVDDLLAQVQVGFDDGQLYIRGPRSVAFGRRRRLDLTIKAPNGSSCAAKTASADLACVGDLSALTVQTASGDVTAASVSGEVTVQSASGDVLLDRTGGDVAIRTASGDVHASRVDGYARISTASGDVAIGYCASSVTMQTASGDIRLGAVAAGQIELRSTSGDMQVGVVPGIGVYLDLASTSGSIHSALDPSNSDDDPDESGVPVQISCRTLSGDIRITKATGVTSPPVAGSAFPAASAREQAAPGHEPSEHAQPEQAAP
jgi:Putative adhesin